MGGRSSDLYQDQKTYYYIATFDHLSRKHRPNSDKSFVVLLTNVYWISPQNQITPYLNLPKSAKKLKKILVADYCWVTLNATWFELPIELFKNDQVLFKANIESYSIIKKKRQKIWNQAQIKNQALHANWKVRRKQLYGPQSPQLFKQ